ncbi:putative p44-42 outer membrane protein, silent [Anaplasma phagocytophilum str. CRT53-1]|uniref:Putative p44-42 outer membrane protein, silent n=1 Tax=Anaplasma phagocytophilum str. CRT53-1 TaxID=1359157 RepID=A0A0F3PUY7_ANAPH|nr:putative p44-42 outer membrane protein, silent [Anaplasma phagocytophilum str. CRT53-1]
MEISSPNIDKKVCRTKSGKNQNNYGKYEGTTQAVRTGSNHGTSLCGDYGALSSHSDGSSVPEVLKHFVEKTLKGDGSKNWPTSTGTGSSSNDNAKAVAKDLVQELTPEEKTIVAGLLAKTIEGGEVVGIRAVSSTSVMVNAEFEIIRLCSIEG